MSSQDTRDRFAGADRASFRPGDAEAAGRGAAHHDHRVDRLIDRLPERWARAVQWLRHPSARWARIPAGILFIIGGFLAILPILGLWMIPLGLILLAEDVPPLRRLRGRLLDWVERRWPHLFHHKQIGDKEEKT